MAQDSTALAAASQIALTDLTQTCSEVISMTNFGAFGACRRAVFTIRRH